jgi:hypothetical protein
VCNSCSAAIAGEYALKLAALPMQLPSDPDPFLSFAYRIERRLRSLARDWEDGDLSPLKWLQDFSTLVRDSHIDAHLIGQQMAGGDGVLMHALAVGGSIADNESEFIQGFYLDLVNGRYDGKADALMARQNLYLGKMRGTAGQGFLDGSPDLSLFYWTLGGAEDHCKECPDIASNSPYTKWTMYTTPGACDTPCLGNCLCSLERGDGAMGPAPILRVAA